MYTKRKRKKKNKFISNLKVRRRRISRGFKVWFKRIFITLLVLGILGGLYYLIYISSTFKIDYFQITGTAKYVNQADLNNVLNSNYAEENLIFLDTFKTENFLKDIFLGAREIKIKKRWPNKLLVQVKEREPLAILYNDRYPDNYMVDQEGYVLGVVDSSAEGLPEINYTGELKVGSFVNQDLIPIYTELLAGFEEYDLKVSSISFHPSYVSFYTQEGSKVLVDNKKDKFQALSVLSRLLKKLSLEGKDAINVDLRYDKVVVSY